MVSLMFWKSGVIRKVCASPKVAETRGVIKLVNDSMNMAKQISILMMDNVTLSVFTYSRPLL